jgi:hypothetical protein
MFSFDVSLVSFANYAEYSKIIYPSLPSILSQLFISMINRKCYVTNLSLVEFMNPTCVQFSNRWLI